MVPVSLEIKEEPLMEQSDNGSFTVPQIRDLLHISKVTAYEISKIPELNRKLVAGQYRILKNDFWKWYNSQEHYRIFDDKLIRSDYFTTRDIAEMFGWQPNGALCFVKRNGLAADVSGFRKYVRKDVFIDWYVHQFRYTSDDPRLPYKENTPVYDIDEVRDMLGIRSTSTIYRIYRREKLTVFRVERRTLVEKESFDNWFLNQTEYPRKEK